nr:hypothetical protein CFP56_25768 [Quercus suber]
MSPVRADDIFGPRTLLYEQSLLQVVPSALLLLSLPIRTFQLRRQNVKTLRNGTRTVKQIIIAAFAATQLALLVAWSMTPAPENRTSASVPAAVVSFTASLALLFLSSIEHTRSVRPSTSINVYLLVSLLFDIPQARTLWLSSNTPYVPGIYTAGVAAKAIVLLFEARNKKRSLLAPYRAYGPEALVSIYDRTVLWWLNPLFFQGYKSSIPLDNLYHLDTDLNAHGAEQAIKNSWFRRECLAG